MPLADLSDDENTTILNKIMGSSLEAMRGDITELGDTPTLRKITRYFIEGIIREEYAKIISK